MSLVIFHHPLHAKLAQDVLGALKRAPDALRGGSTVSIGQIRFDQFNDGTPKPFIEELKRYAGCNGVYLALFRPETFFAEYAVLRTLVRRYIHSLHIMLPYFPYGTMERESEFGEVATAKTLLSLLDGLPQCAKGALPFLTTYDLHALGLPFYSDDKLQLRNQTTLALLSRALNGIPNELIAFAFPDKGARQRFNEPVQKQFPGVPLIVCEKTRRGDKRDIVILEGDPSGKHVIIIDDLVQSGGTLIECAKLMRANAAIAVSSFTPHGVCPGGAWKKFTRKTFTHAWFTDSVPEMSARSGEGAITILSLADQIAEDIRWHQSI